MNKLKDKDETKRKIIEAVGKTIKEQGFSNLKISKICKLANVDRKLVYRYFGGLQGLVEAYVIENDYFMTFSQTLHEAIQDIAPDKIKNLIITILQNQFRHFYSEKKIQDLILWEISQENPLMKSIHNVRETTGQKILEMTDSHFTGSKVNIRAVTALLIGGIYYAVLHARFNGGMISDVDINSEAGYNSIVDALDQIVTLAFDHAEKFKV